MDGTMALRRAWIAGSVGALAWAAGPAGAGFQYVHDDGSGGFNIGPSSFDATMIWGNYFTAQPGAGTLVSLEISFSSSLGAGRALELLVFEDLDDDGDPRNAVVVYQGSAETIQTGPGVFASYAIDPTAVSGGFFVAAAVSVPRGQSVARADQDNPGTNSWLFFDGSLNTDLSSTPFQLRMSEGPFNAAWMFRATAVPGPGVAGVGIPLVCGMISRRRRSA
jgi:hypothetical protein